MPHKVRSVGHVGLAPGRERRKDRHEQPRKGTNIITFFCVFRVLSWLLLEGEKVPSCETEAVLGSFLWG